jgi:hypothetical protein
MRRRASPAAILALPLVAAACGGGGGGGGSAAPTLGHLTPLAYVKHATKQTATAPQHTRIKAKLDASGQQGTFDADGAFDVRKHLGALHLDLNVAGFSGSIDEIIAGTAVYMKSPLFSSSLPKGKEWLKLDVKKLAKARGLNYSTLLSQDPSHTLGQLKGLVKVKKVGVENVDGTTTTHFRGNLDLSKVPLSARLKLQNATFTPVDIWVGGDGYIRREKFGAAFIVPNGDADLFMQIDYSDFGKPVDVNAPADSQVLDMTSLGLPGLGG